MAGNEPVEDPFDDRGAERDRMVDRHIVARGITDATTIAAMRTVRRHGFVPAAMAFDAYADRPLPIGHGATISQPYIVALMTEALRLRPQDRVLEVGTGSGYGAAVLAECAGHVTTIESVEALATGARIRLTAFAPRVEVIVGDGSEGYEPSGPFDAISVTAAAPQIPPPLLAQLAPGGRLVMPVGRGAEELVRIERTPDGDRRDVICAVRFVPLTGRHGTGEPSPAG
ncbi:MAG: protein-L-isoaspartate(D-aspartate) O-methyltransferase [Ilumatobacteraceae bacterium]